MAWRSHAHLCTPRKSTKRAAEAALISHLASHSDQRTLKFSAEVLPLFETSSNSMACPSLSPLRPARSTAEMWTNTSLPPPRGWMKPCPFAN